MPTYTSGMKKVGIIMSNANTCDMLPAAAKHQTQTRWFLYLVFPKEGKNNLLSHVTEHSQLVIKLKFLHLVFFKELSIYKLNWQR